MLPDRTVPLLLNGYDYLTRLRWRTGRDTIPMRFIGRRAVSVVGPEATRFFYDPDLFDRQGVAPPNIQWTLFGDAGVQLLDGPSHANRKAVFLSVLDEGGSQELTDAVARAWDDAMPGWQRADRVVVFDATAELLTRAVHAWAGVPLVEEDVAGTAADLVALIDGFASLGPRFVRGRSARSRQDARIARLVREVRAGERSCPPGSPFAAFVGHRDEAGEPLDEHTVAVEVLNLLRPTVAVAWYLAFAGHALHYWPAERDLLRAEGRERAVAFAHELRRFYPLTPLLAARARRDLSFDGVPIPEGTLAVLDVFGQDRHPGLWEEPGRFSSDRHLGRQPGEYELIPQGGGPVTGHRCPGEPAVVSILATLVPRLARLDYTVPEQDLRITRRRIPARVGSGFVVSLRT